MQFFGRSTLTLILIGWHFVLAASGHGLHRLIGAADCCAETASALCQCSHVGAARGLGDSAAVTGGEPQIASGLRHRGTHDPDHCAICQWLAQHKTLPPASATVAIAQPLADLLRSAIGMPHGTCVCPYSSRAPPGASRFA